jgi:ELWxxDGT repeat protein
MIQDLNRYTHPSSPAQIVRSGTSIFFTADDGIHGRELWIYDDQEVRMVKDIIPGSGDPSIDYPVGINGLLLFVATDPEHHNRKGLWVSDGTESGTYLLASTDRLRYPKYLHVAGDGYVYFSAQTFDASGNDLGRELWHSDGTKGNTLFVGDTIAGNDGLDPFGFAWVGGTNLLYFSGYDASGKKGLWTYDPVANTLPQLVSGSAGVSPMCIFPFGGGVLFSGYDTTKGRELWQANVTAAGASMVADLRSNSADSNPNQFVYAGGGKAYFVAHDGNHRYLYLTDGTATNTGIVSTNPTYPTYLTMVGSTLYFVANSGSSVMLWRSDGTSGGTEMIDTTPNTPLAESISNLTSFGGKLYFFGKYILDGVVHKSVLWSYTPGDAHEKIIHEFDPQNGIYFYANIAGGSDGNIYFSAYDIPHSKELWRSDGTDAGTQMVHDIRIQTRPSSAINLPKPITHGSYTYYIAITSASDEHRSLLRTHRSDGTTQSIIENPQLDVAAITEYDGNMYAVDYNVSSDTARLWSIDDASGTLTKLGEYSGVQPKINALACAAGSLYLIAKNGSQDDLMRYDIATKAISTSHSSASIRWVAAVDDTLFFSAADSTHGLELWWYDGTTKHVEDIWSGAAPSTPKQPTVLQDWLYFVADDGTGNGGADLWRIKKDGTSLMQISDIDNSASLLGDPMIGMLYATDDAIYFSAEENDAGFYLWRHTPDTTTVEKLDTVPLPMQYASIGNTLYCLISGTSNNQLTRITRTQATVLDEEPTKLYGTVGDQIVYGKIVDGKTQVWIGDGTTANASALVDTLP